MNKVDYVVPYECGELVQFNAPASIYELSRSGNWLARLHPDKDTGLVIGLFQGPPYPMITILSSSGILGCVYVDQVRHL